MENRSAWSSSGTLRWLVLDGCRATMGRQSVGLLATLEFRWRLQRRIAALRAESAAAPTNGQRMQSTLTHFSRIGRGWPGICLSAEGPAKRAGGDTRAVACGLPCLRRMRFGGVGAGDVQRITVGTVEVPTVACTALLLTEREDAQSQQPESPGSGMRAWMRSCSGSCCHQSRPTRRR
jgi:hypothetical protein